MIMEEADQLDVLRTLDTLSLADAKAAALRMLPDTDKKANINRLRYDIEQARSAKEVCGIAWRMYMAKSGMRVNGSAWNKHYRSI